MNKTKIGWTDSTWNPCTGCSKISKGCLNCYAELFSIRLEAMGKPKYRDGFTLTQHPKSLQEPYHWKKPKKIFVNSMSDLFHEKMPFDFIQKVFKVMNENPQHTFQVLTKRADVLEKYSPQLTWTDNIWMGVTVESNEYYYRIDALRKTGARIKFISCEPLLSSVDDMPLKDINWVIAGGESGRGKKIRPMEEDWVKEIARNCWIENVPFYFKQWGGKRRKECSIDGEEIKEFPGMQCRYI